jgi:hypothetical protein
MQIPFMFLVIYQILTHWLNSHFPSDEIAEEFPECDDVEQNRDLNAGLLYCIVEQMVGQPVYHRLKAIYMQMIK